jgi:hypothetical protein
MLNSRIHDLEASAVPTVLKDELSDFADFSGCLDLIWHGFLLH